MPELPEVETVARFLQQRVVGSPIVKVDVHWARSVSTPKVTEFTSRLQNRVIRRAWRRGKFIVCDLDDGSNLLCHLRMSGDLRCLAQGEPPATHDRVIFHLASGGSLRFYDPRKFGRLYLVDHYNQITAKLGVEPLSVDFTPPYLARIMKDRRGCIKTFLLNQRFIAGLGNIYVVESLWHAGIHPLREPRRVPYAKIEALCRAIQEVLGRAVASGGTDLGDGVWKYGSNAVKAYGREGLPCFRCGQKIKRLIIAQRGSDYCPRCQRR